MIESSFGSVPAPLATVITSTVGRAQSVLGLSLAFGSLVLAIFVAPESPDQLASICEKYNSVIACRVS